MRRGRFIARVEIITPNWLRVERAIIFLRSHSTMAAIPAISMVIEDIYRRDGWNMGVVLRNGKKRMRIKTPAVTSVDEWTNAETGVGAAIAAGSQLENGIWALLVIAAIVKHNTTHGLWIVVLRTSQWPWFNSSAIEIRKSTSPIRFISAVIIPAPRDLGV